MPPPVAHVCLPLTLCFTCSGGYTPLMHAARSGSLPTVQALLSAGADPRPRGTDGWNRTAADLARMAGDLESELIVQALEEAEQRMDEGAGL